MFTEKWIGDRINTSGGYPLCSDCVELSLKNGGVYKDDTRLYKFCNRFGGEYYITDPEVVARIDELRKLGNLDDLYEYLYTLIIEKFGMTEFLKQIKMKIMDESSNGYSSGIRSIQRDMKKLMGLD